MPYFALCILLEQVIINVLQKSYNITYAKAYKIWYYASMEEDPRVRAIIENLIAAGKVSGLLNRNPTISYESMLYVRVTKCTSGFSLTINSWCLVGLNADELYLICTFLQRIILNNKFNILLLEEVLSYGNM